jgi:hypothetical protein
LAKSSFPSLKTPTVLSQQERANPVGKAFANTIGIFANTLALLAKHPFPVVDATLLHHPKRIMQTSKTRWRFLTTPRRCMIKTLEQG